MNSKPKVSIILPVYNVEGQVKKCLDSIVSQTFQDFECIIIDDGSTDQSALICDKYIQKDDRIKMLHQKNAGLSAARNYAMTVVKGDYISFVDSDDYLMPKYLETMLRLMEIYNADIVKCDYFRGILETESEEKEISVLTGKKFTEKLLTDQIGSQLWQYVFKADLWNEIESPLGRYAQDMMILHLVTDKAFKIVQTTEKLYFYFIDRSDSTSNTKKNKAKGAFDRAIAFKLRYEFATSKGYEKCVRKLMTNVLDFYNNALTLMKSNQNELCEDIQTLSLFLKKKRKNWSIQNVGIKHHILGILLAYFPYQYAKVRGK